MTTSPIDAGEPGTTYSEEPPGDLRLVLAKAGRGTEAGVVFERYVT